MSIGDVHPNFPFDLVDGSVRLRLSVATYSDYAIQKAAYRLARKCAVHLEPREDGFMVTLVPERLVDSDSSRQLVVDFLRQLNDELLRERIGEQTNGIRELLLAHAFSRSGLVDVE